MRTPGPEGTRLRLQSRLKPAEILKSGGHGEYDPVAANDSPERRALNRRIEIILQPNLTELPSVEGAKASGG